MNFRNILTVCQTLAKIAHPELDEHDLEWRAYVERFGQAEAQKIEALAIRTLDELNDITGK
jgi:hypothetical protein